MKRPIKHYKEHSALSTSVDSDNTEANEEVQIAAEVRKIPAEDFVKNSYGPFAYYTIRHRALVSDDGLKPVNRRILYAMLKFGVSPSTSHQKAAKIAGYCTTWHPHGDAAIADAMARMGQTFSMRVPLIDTKGSVGFVSGDKPAAPRYWEARPTEAAMELLREIKDGAVEMGTNYDGSEDEPDQLPVRFPNNVISGSDGIAVGYASKMAPHNPTEAMDAVLLGIKKGDKLTADDLLKVMPGPDFPTGGEILEVEGVKEYYETGNGRFVVRGRYEVENLPRGKARIIFSELPFAVPAEKVIEAVKNAQQKNKLKEISSIKDLTDRRNGLRISIETKSGSNPKQVIADIFKNTPAESSFSVNNTVLIGGLPTVVSMVDLIKGFIEFRKLCVTNKANFRKAKIVHRMGQVDALLAVLIDIDKCISIIRTSDSQDEAKSRLVKDFAIDETQAEYVLSMQLRRLTRSDSLALEKEKESLVEENKNLETMLADDSLLLKQVAKEARETKKIVDDERRTSISGLTAEEIKEAEKSIREEAKIREKNTDCFVTMFSNGKLLKTLEAFDHKPTAKRITNGPVRTQLKMKTQDNVVVITSDGTGHRIPMHYLIEGAPSSNTQFGVQLTKGTHVVGVAKDSTSGGEQGILMMTDKGTVKIAKTDFPQNDEFTVFSIKDDEKILTAQWIPESGGQIVSISSDSNLLRFSADDVRASGSRAGGVRGQKLAEGHHVVHASWLPQAKIDNKDPETGVKVVSKTDQTIKMTMLSEYSVKGRGTQGMRCHPFKKGEDKVVSAFVGEGIAATLTGNSTAVNMPPISKKSTTGQDVKFDIDLGLRKA